MLAIPTAIFAKPYAAKSSALQNVVILIIRHAEKPDEGYGLSADGEARAKAYVNYFKNFTVDGQPLKLDYIFAAADSMNPKREKSYLDPSKNLVGNLATGETTQIKAKRVVKFRVAKAAKDAILGVKKYPTSRSCGVARWIFKLRVEPKELDDARV